jgi:DNA-binding Lrp family transcriptional regulator
MDSIKLLELLEQDAMLSVKDLATMLNSSEKEVDKAIADLKKRGVIRKFKAVVDWKKADGKHASALIQVKVVPQEKHGFARICRELAKEKMVNDIYVVTGEYDLVITATAGSIDEISEFITEKLAPRKEVMGTNTHIILKEFKRAGILMFDEDSKRLLLAP